MTRPATACLGLGSNLGEREAHLRHALRRLDELPGCVLLAVSSILETEPVGPVEQDRYLNAAALVRTTLPPRELLERLQGVERERLRDRRSGERWGPRTLDIDILLYDDLVIDEPGLTIPHPCLHERLFALEPLAEIAPDARIPTLGKTVAEVLAGLRSGRAGGRQ